MSERVAIQQNLFDPTYNKVMIESTDRVTGTSKVAYRSINDSGLIETQRQFILDTISMYPGITRRGIQRKTGIEINAVSGRVRELMIALTVYEGRKVRDDGTKQLGSTLYTTGL